MNNLTISRNTCTLLVIDIQGRLMPAINDGQSVIKNAQRLFEVPLLVTEQNPAGLGATTPDLKTGATPAISKMTFDATCAQGFHEALGSRDPGNRTAAIERLRNHGAEIVTTEMVLFEWTDSAEHPNFRELVALVK